MSKLTDIDTINKLGEPAYHAYLEYVGANADNASGKSNKFWEVAVFAPTDNKELVAELNGLCSKSKAEARAGRYLVIRRWGKYGAKGQMQIESAYSNFAAVGHAREMKAKKRGKGYTKEVDVITRLSSLVEDA